jgi:hypothetical protein
VKKILAVLFAFAFPFLAGCTPEIIRAGAERDMALYSSQIAMEATRINVPACRITAKPGEEIMLSGVESFECFGNSSGGYNEITQRISPAWNFLSQNSGILGMLGFSALMFPNGLQAQVVQPNVVNTPNPLVVEPLIVRP